MSLNDDKCDHPSWRHIVDYEGDPGVIGGINRIECWECLDCGYTTGAEPNNWASYDRDYWEDEEPDYSDCCR